MSRTPDQIAAWQQAQAAGGGSPWGLLAQLHSRSPKARKILTAYGAALAGWRAYNHGKNWVQTRRMYSLSILSTDNIYNDVHEKLLAMMPSKARRALVVGSARARISLSDGEINREASGQLIAYYDGETSQTVSIAGHKVIVFKENHDGARGDQTSGYQSYKPDRIKLIMYSAEARDAILNWLHDIVDAQVVSKEPRFWIMSRWGDWQRRADLERRTLDSVVLHKNQAEALIDDLGAFLSWKDAYAKFGIPYHRGYLFHGPPGSGKTSLARALAGHFDLDLYYAPLSDLEKDASLLQLVSSVTEGSVLLLEDVDVLHAARERDDDGWGITLSGLLNALDGVSTPSGIVTIMTSNHADVLDDALVRPGRVDRVEHLGYLDDEQLGRLMLMLVGNNDRALPSVEGLSISPADVLEAMKRHLLDPADGVDEVMSFILRKQDQLVRTNGRR